MYCLLSLSLFVYFKLTLRFKFSSRPRAVPRRAVKYQQARAGGRLDTEKVLNKKRELEEIHTLTAAVPALDGTQFPLLAAQRQGAGTT